MMVYVYAQLIIKGYYIFKDVPLEKKEEIRNELITLGREELIIE